MADPIFIILAAGKSERLGEPKALVEVCERPLIALQIERLRSISEFQIIIVTLKDLEDDIDQIIEIYENVEYCINDFPEKGRTGSLQIAMNLLENDVEKLIVVPVDRPGWSRETLEHLIRKDHSSCPTKDSKGGHPVMIVGNDIDIIKKAQPHEPLNSLFKTNRFEVNDSYLHLNIDTKKDIDTLREFAESLDY
tara:strand:+ start:155 stop:736 length:582 start_codon:yes stop_codon:yes gene_type:complete